MLRSVGTISRKRLEGGLSLLGVCVYLLLIALLGLTWALVFLVPWILLCAVLRRRYLRPR